MAGSASATIKMRIIHTLLLICPTDSINFAVIDYGQFGMVGAFGNTYPISGCSLPPMGGIPIIGKLLPNLTVAECNGKLAMIVKMVGHHRGLLPT